MKKVFHIPQSVRLCIRRGWWVRVKCYGIPVLQKKTLANECMHYTFKWIIWGELYMKISKKNTSDDVIDQVYKNVFDLNSCNLYCDLQMLYKILSVNKTSTWWHACQSQALLGMKGLKSAVPMLAMAVVNLALVISSSTVTTLRKILWNQGGLIKLY